MICPKSVAPPVKTIIVDIDGDHILVFFVFLSGTYRNIKEKNKTESPDPCPYPPKPKPTSTKKANLSPLVMDDLFLFHATFFFCEHLVWIEKIKSVATARR